MSACIGIISWFPDTGPNRTQRQERINRLLKRINELWATVPVLIIAQNWVNFKPVKTSNKYIIRKFTTGLGILGARKTLRKEFLKLNFDHLVMLDDDALIIAPGDSATKYMETLEAHKQGFCFIHKRNSTNILVSKQDTYASAQLNLCAISKKILTETDFPNIDPQKNQGYEDHIFAALLHATYADLEFLPPKDIYCNQFLNKKEPVPSTWAGNSNIKQNSINEKTNRIIQYIIEHKRLPNVEVFNKYDILIDAKFAEDSPEAKQLIAKALRLRNANGSDGRRTDAYLYW